MRGSDKHTAWGVGGSLLASSLFGLIFYVSGVIDASPENVFGWRMIITAACYAALLATKRGRRAGTALFSAVFATRGRPLVFALAAFLVGVEMWLFTWAPVHEQALNASLGYLLLPIALVLIGRIAFGDRVSGLQWVAVGIAVVAVAINVAATAAVSWVTFTVCLGYALYFAVRRRSRLEGAATFGLEVALTLPVSVPLVLLADGASTSSGRVVVLAAGFAGAVAMSAYVVAAGWLSMPVFGLLSYAEPVLLFVVALVLGERLTDVDVVVYAMLAVALAVLGYSGFRGRPRVRPSRTLPTNQTLV